MASFLKRFMVGHVCMELVGLIRFFFNWRRWRTTSHVILLMSIARVWLCAYSLHGSRRDKAQVSASAHSYHLSAIHGERLIVCCLCPRSVFLRVPFCLLLLLFHTLFALWPALLLPCGQRQGKQLLRLRTTRSIAPWRYTFLPQNMDQDWKNRSEERKTTMLNLETELDNARRLTAFTLLIRMMENSKKPSKMRGENWKFRWRRPCLAKKGTRLKKKSSSPPQETERRGR